MYELFTKTFDTSDFPARWHCGNWSDVHGWTHIISDAAIFAAYAAIPIMLTYFVARRRDTPFLPIFWLFAAFILFCGFGHLCEAIIFYFPFYRFAAIIKASTAIVSWITVISLLRFLPHALALPGLEMVNQQLQGEINERKLAEQKLQTSYDELQLFTSCMVTREERVVELKREINDLLAEMGREPVYKSPM